MGNYGGNNTRETGAQNMEILWTPGTETWQVHNKEHNRCSDERQTETDTMYTQGVISGSKDTCGHSWTEST